MPGEFNAGGVWGRQGGPPEADPFSLSLRVDISQGFTLIELMIVVTLIGFIAALVVPAYMDSLDKARVAQAIGDIAAVQQEIRLFYFDNLNLPDSLADVGRAGLADPYGNLYRYLKIAGAGGNTTGAARKDRFLVPLNSDFDLYSVGQDGQTASALTTSQSQDDVVRANDGGYIGLGSEY